MISDNFFTVTSLRPRLLLLPVACEEERELPATNLAGSTTDFIFRSEPYSNDNLIDPVPVCLGLPSGRPSLSAASSKCRPAAWLWGPTTWTIRGQYTLKTAAQLNLCLSPLFFKRIISPKLQKIKMFLYLFRLRDFCLRFPQFK